MLEDFPRVTLFAPGTPVSVTAWTKALHGGGLRIEGGTLFGDGLDARVEVEWVVSDGTFGAAFAYGTVEKALVETIDAAPSALVLHWPEDLRDGRAQIVGVVERLRTKYPSEHPCHNPYGVWRLGPPGGTARPRGERYLCSCQHYTLCCSRWRHNAARP